LFGLTGKTFANLNRKGDLGLDGLKILIMGKWKWKLGSPRVVYEMIFLNRNMVHGEI